MRYSEPGFAKLKALLRKAADCTVGRPCNTIGRLLEAFAQADCANYLRRWA
jgi:hypothetical protein